MTCFQSSLGSLLKLTSSERPSLTITTYLLAFPLLCFFFFFNNTYTSCLVCCCSPHFVAVKEGVKKRQIRRMTYLSCWQNSTLYSSCYDIFRMYKYNCLEPDKWGGRIKSASCGPLYLCFVLVLLTIFSFLYIESHTFKN